MPMHPSRKLLFLLVLLPIKVFTFIKLQISAYRCHTYLSSCCNIIHTHASLLLTFCCGLIDHLFLCILCSKSYHPASQTFKLFHLNWFFSSVYAAPSVDLNMRYFWQWSAFEDYLLFCCSFTLLCAVVTLMLLDSSVFVEMLGFLAVMFEAMLGLPQLLQNFHNHTTKGMRYITLWGQARLFINLSSRLIAYNDTFPHFNYAQQH